MVNLPLLIAGMAKTTIGTAALLAFPADDLKKDSHMPVACKKAPQSDPMADPEPLAESPDVELELAARQTTADYIMARMNRAQSCSSRNQVLDIALSQLPNDGLVCEFGVFEGETINYIAEKLPSRIIFGFDSFEGLPERWREAFCPGTFSTGGQLPRVRPNVRLRKGWFDATLPGFAAQHTGAIAFLHVDCDLYSSTRCIFEYLGKSLKAGSIIVFDEYFNYPGWEQHEFRAFSEFVVREGLGYEYLAYNQLHEQAAVRITG